MTVGDFPLSGKIAVVTGAGSGINLAFAKLAEQQGAKVVIADVKLTDDAKTFVAARKAKGNVIFVPCDVTKRADLENLVQESEKQFGDVPDAWSNFWDDTEGDGYKEVDINVNHPIKLSRIAIRSLIKKGKPGVVLVVASLAGYQGTFASPLYCATKHACVGFVRSVAELDRLQNIKFVLVAPGLVHTPLWTNHPEKMKQFGYTEENAVKPETVAARMIDLVTSGQYGGGSCLEVAAAGTRLLGTWDIPAPDSRGTTVDESALEESYRPVLEKLQSEKAAS